eukprot:3540679-Amphidinium_carterae.1
MQWSSRVARGSVRSAPRRQTSFWQRWKCFRLSHAFDTREELRAAYSTVLSGPMGLQDHQGRASAMYTGQKFKQRSLNVVTRLSNFEAHHNSDNTVCGLLGRSVPNPAQRPFVAREKRRRQMEDPLNLLQSHHATHRIVTALPVEC